MRLLADENFNSVEVKMIRSRGHDLVWIEEETPGIDDQVVLSRATAEGRILLTCDKDFGDLIFRDKLKAPFGVILFRIPQNTPDRTRTIIAELESRTGWAGHFSTIDENGLRRRRLPNS